MIRRLRENLYPLSFLLVIPFLNIFYVLLNRDNGEVFSLATDIDRAIPFMPVFVLPYIAWYLFLPITFIYFCLKDKSIYYKTLITYIISLIVCYITYFFFQTTVERPVLTEEDIFTQMVRYIYQRDAPYNAFPSIHAFTSYLMMKVILKSPFKNRVNVTVIGCLAVLIMISTLFIKQHVIMDIFAAIILVDLVYNAVDKVSEGAWLQRRKKMRALSILKDVE